MNGRICNILEDKGYFFVRGDDGVEYFAHKSSLRKCRWEDIQYDDAVEFTPDEGPKGPRAEEVIVTRLVA